MARFRASNSILPQMRFVRVASQIARFRQTVVGDLPAVRIEALSVDLAENMITCP